MADFAVWRRHFAVFALKFLQIAHTHYQTIVKRHIPAIRRSADIDMNVFNLVRTGKFAGLRRTGKLKIPVFKISAVPFGRMLSGLFVIAGRLLRRRNRQSAKLGKIYLCAVRTAQPAKNRIFKSYNLPGICPQTDIYKIINNQSCVIVSPPVNKMFPRRNKTIGGKRYSSSL